MTPQEFLDLLPNLSDGTLQQDYAKKSEQHEMLMSAMKVLENEQEAIRLVTLAFQVNRDLGARLAGLATSSVEKSVSQKFKLLLENEEIVWKRNYGLEFDRKIELLGRTLAQWAIPDLEILLHQTYYSYKVTVALGWIASKGNTQLAKDEATSVLLQGLNYENERTKSSIIDQLAGIGSDRAVETLLKILKEDKDWVMRTHAVRALVAIGDARAEDGYIDALNDPHEYVRQSAIEGLGNLKSTKSCELLMAKLQDSNSHARCCAIEALAKMGYEKAVKPLISMLRKDDNPPVRWRSAEALGTLGKEEAFEPLILALQDEHLMVRKMAIKALGDIRSDRAIEPLTQIAINSESLLRQQAIFALNQITRENGLPLPIEPLVACLSDNELQVKQLAAQKLLLKTDYLGKFPQSLLNGLQHPSVTIRVESVKSLTQMKAEQLEELGVDLVIEALTSTLLNDTSITVRKFTAINLGNFSNEKAIAPLISVLQNKTEDRSLRRNAVYGLEKIGTEQIFQPIIFALKDNIPSVRIAASSVLSRIAGDWAIKDLVASLADKDWRVYRNCCQALIKVNNTKVEEELLKTLNNDETIFSHRNNIISLLPQIGGKKFFEILISLLTFSNKSLKSYSLKAIGEFSRQWLNADYINDAVEPVINTLSDRNNHLDIVLALESIGIHPQCTFKNQGSIISALKTIVENDKSTNIGRYATNALNKIPRQTAVDNLIKKLGEIIHGQINLVVETIKQLST